MGMYWEEIALTAEGLGRAGAQAVRRVKRMKVA